MVNRKPLFGWVGGTLTVVFFAWLAFGAACLLLPVGNHEQKPTYGNTPRSPRWPAVRAKHLAEHPTCAACGCRDDLQVHHKVPYATDPTKELDPENLITLCGKKANNDHLWIGHSGNYQYYNPNVVEDAALKLRRIKERLPNH